MTRVCLLLPDLAGGAERVTLVIAEALAERGYLVDLVLGNASGPLLPDVPVRVPVVDLAADRMVRALPDFARYLSTRRPDVVVSALSHANILAVVATKLRLRRIPLILIEHNTMSVKIAAATGRRDRLLPRLSKMSYRAADLIGAVSEGVADDLAATLGIARDRIQVLPNPIDYAEISQRSAEAAAHPWLADLNRPIVVAVGRLTEQKDFPTLLSAMVHVAPRARLIILGDGVERAALASLVDDLGLADRVSMPGFLPNPYPYLARADVVAMSSRWEGLPTVLLEALPFPARLVSTDCPSGPRQILGDGRFGRLVPVGAPAALAEAITAALADAPADRSKAWAAYDKPAAIAHYCAAIDRLTS